MKYWQKIKFARPAWGLAKDIDWMVPVQRLAIFVMELERFLQIRISKDFFIYRIILEIIRLCQISEHTPKIEYAERLIVTDLLKKLDQN